MKYAYIRVSTGKQDYLRQEFALKDITVDKVFEEKISGTKKSKTRPAFEEMFNILESGDELYIESMSRLARSVQDLISTTDELLKKGICVHFLKEGLHLNGDGDAVSRMVFNIMAAVAQFERDLTSDRTKETLQAKKAQGVKLGRETQYGDEIVSKVNEYREMGMSMQNIADELGIAKSTVSRIVNNKRVNG